MNIPGAVCLLELAEGGLDGEDDAVVPVIRQHLQDRLLIAETPELNSFFIFFFVCRKARKGSQYNVISDPLEEQAFSLISVISRKSWLDFLNTFFIGFSLHSTILDQVLTVLGRA
jgi:hypothetical protein